MQRPGAEGTDGGAEPGSYAFGRDAYSAKASRGDSRASSETMSRLKKKLRIQFVNTRTLRSHMGMASP